MTEHDLIPAKATNPAEQSDSIVVSFGAEWHDHLITKDFSVVIRKRVPKHTSFEWLYFHINNPISAICARAPIEKLFTASTKQVLAMAPQICLKPEEIRAYLSGDSSVCCYQLGAFQFPSAPLTAKALALRMAYHPPQSFFIVSHQAKAIIDKMADFSDIAKRRSAKKPNK